MGAKPGRRSLKMPAEKLGPVIVASYYSFGFIRLFFFPFFGVFSGDFGLLYSRSIPDLLLFLNCFLSVGQWAPFN